MQVIAISRFSFVHIERVGAARAGELRLEGHYRTGRQCRPPASLVTSPIGFANFVTGSEGRYVRRSPVGSLPAELAGGRIRTVERAVRNTLPRCRSRMDVTLACAG